jgi:hypothetical protein
MYIIGSIPELGNGVTPMKMSMTNKKDISNINFTNQQVTGELVQQWYYLIEVSPNSFHIRYFYVMKNEADSTMIWERGFGRLLTSDNIDRFRIVNDEFYDSPLQIKAQMHTYIEKERFQS